MNQDFRNGLDRVNSLRTAKNAWVDIQSFI